MIDARKLVEVQACLDELGIEQRLTNTENQSRKTWTVSGVRTINGEAPDDKGDIAITTGGGDVSIGSTITGGDDNAVLFVNPAGTLAEDAANFGYETATGTLTISNLISKSEVPIVIQGSPGTAGMVAGAAAQVTAGDGYGIGTGGNGGDFQLLAGNAQGSGDNAGGSAYFTGGDGTGSGAGGSATFTAGSSGGTGVGGNVLFNGGDGGASLGDGGSIIFTSGDSLGSGNSGNIDFITGAVIEGTEGDFRFDNGGTGTYGILNFGSVATSNKTYTFPNFSGTVALTSTTLVSGRVPYVTTNGLLTDDADFTWDGTALGVAVNNITTTTTQGLAIQNTTASTAGVTTQYSPALDFIGHAYRTLAADRTIRFRQELIPVAGASPSGTLTWSSSVDTGTASFTSRATLTSAGAFSSTSLTASGLTAGGVALIGTGGLLTYDAGILYNTSTDLLTLATTGSGAGLAFGASGTPPQFYESTATSGSGDTLVNSGVAFRRGNLTVNAPTHTSTTANEFGMQVTKTFTPGAASSGRTWGLSFNVTGSGSANFTDNTSAIVGVEGTVSNNSTATMTAMSASILFNAMGANSTTTRFTGIDIYGADVSGSGGVGATATEASGALIRMGRSSGNTSVGNIGALWGVQLRASTWSGTGHMTSQFGMGYYTGQTMNSITANSQVRVMYDVPVMPDPGAFTGTTVVGLRFGAGTTSRDGILWGTDTNLYRSAANVLATDDGIDAALDVRARQLIADGSSGGTASTNTFTNGTDGVSATPIVTYDSTSTGLSHQGYIKIYVGTTEAWVPYYVVTG